MAEIITELGLLGSFHGQMLHLGRPCIHSKISRQKIQGSFPDGPGRSCQANKHTKHIGQPRSVLTDDGKYFPTIHLPYVCFMILLHIHHSLLHSFQVNSITCTSIITLFTHHNPSLSSCAWKRSTKLGAFMDLWRQCGEDGYCLLPLSLTYKSIVLSIHSFDAISPPTKSFLLPLPPSFLILLPRQSTFHTVTHTNKLKCKALGANESSLSFSTKN